MQNNKMYCVYLTIYLGINLPPFYIGSKDTASVLTGYRGSVSSKKWKLIWQEELKLNPELFNTHILSYHRTRKEAFLEEDKMQHKLDAVNSQHFINEAYANRTFHVKPHSPESILKMKEARSKFLETVDKQKWYAEVAKKQKQTKQKQWADPELRKIKSDNISKGQNNRSQEEKESHAKKIADGWASRNDDQKKAYSAKRSELAKAQFANLSDEQKAIISKRHSEMQVRLQCPHCGKIGIKPNMNRWHFNNCKTIK